jgi:hypothetical protein
MHLLIDILRNSILITGLVVVMMMMIESLNIESKGLIFKGLKKTKFGQVVIGALLGSIPGCMGGFATVSLYTHRMFSFGALVAMMIASSGDEAFIMLAMIPDQALILFAVLFVIAVVVGIATDMVYTPKEVSSHTYPKHEECHSETPSEHSRRHFGWKRITMFIGLAVFIGALASGGLAHDHAVHVHENGVHCTHEHEHHHDDCTQEDHHSKPTEVHHTINLLDEQWMNVLFAGLSVLVLLVLLFSSDHFVEEHLWNHIVKKHLPVIFAWTFGVLLVLGIGLQYVEIDRWISDNTALMILLATLIGIIPESGPHLIFVTLFAAGVVPFPVLLASSISQDGHASIPLLAESKKSFLWAKLINCGVALIAGFAAMLIM